jgi:DNA-binding transcriptional ArsR family regulator
VARITLDARTFQALASSTRLTVLRALDERRKTLTELARDLELNKATVHEHLQLLTAAGLVRKRDDEGRKWIYYELTWTGERLLHPQETTTFNVLLGLAVAAAGGGFLVLGRALGWWLATRAPDPMAEDASEKSEPQADVAAAGAASESPPQTGSATSGPSPGGAPPPSPPESGAALYATQVPDQAAQPAPEPTDFFDEGGWLAIVLVLAATIFTSLALLLRRQIRPGRFVAPQGEEAEGPGGEAGEPGHPPGPNK